MVRYLHTMPKTILSLTLIILLCSCMPKIPMDIKVRFKSCYDPKKNVAAGKIGTTGYFRQRTSYYEPTGKALVIIHYFMFFEDGIYWSGIYDHREFGNRIDIDDYFDRLISKNTRDSEEAALQRGSGRQGLYTISNDTIRTETLNNPAPPAQYSLENEMFVIIDKNTVQEISSSSDRVYEPATFIPIKAPITSDSWIQLETWVYCNSADAPVKN